MLSNNNHSRRLNGKHAAHDMANPRVYIGNLNPEAEQRDLEDFFRGYTLAKVWIARQPPGFAYVEFSDQR